jgi:hypothetical protein
MLIALTVAVALVGRYVRLADRINVPVHPATDWVRSGQRFGTIRRDPGRRHGVGDLFHRRFHDPAGNAAVDASKPPDQAKGKVRWVDNYCLRTLAWQRRLGDLCPCAGLSVRILKMPNSRPNLAFFALIAASLCAAAVLAGLLIAGDIAGPGVNNLPPHSQAGDRGMQ